MDLREMESSLPLIPPTPEDLAAALRQAAEAGRTVELDGLGSKRAWGGPVEECETRLSTRALNRILQYEPRDLTISVEAGLPFRELKAALAANQQMVPLDPPLEMEGSVGGVIAANLSGPRRRLYGSARDMVIGMTLATLEGQLVKTGGMVVKNVAGLDVQKLMIGSYGTLAAIVSVNFKVAPLPEMTRTLLQSSSTAKEAAEACGRILRGVLQPVAIDVLNPAAAKRCGLDGFVVLIQAAGTRRVLDRYSHELAGAQTVEGSAEDGLWATLREFTPEFLRANPEGAAVRVGLPMSQLGALMESCETPVVARGGNGVAVAYLDDPVEAARFASTLAARGWSAVVEATSAPNKGGLELWPSPGADLEPMQRMKALFDPKSLLNRGRMYGRL